MKKYNIIVLICLSSILTLSGDRFISSLLSNVVEKSDFKYSKLYNDRAQCDILFFGDSRGLIFYQPTVEQLTNESTFNLSYNGISSGMALALIEDYFELYDPPRLLIFEATVRGDNDRLTPSFKVYSQYSDNIKNVINDIDKSILNYAKVFNLILYNSEVFQRVIHYYNKPDTEWINTKSISDEAYAEEIPLDEYIISEKSIQNFIKIKELCDKHNTECKFIINPFLPKYIPTVINFNEYINGLTTGINYDILNYSDSIKDMKMFSDYIHLNKTGSEYYMNMLYDNGVFD